MNILKSINFSLLEKTLDHDRGEFKIKGTLVVKFNNKRKWVIDFDSSKEHEKKDISENMKFLVCCTFLIENIVTKFDSDFEFDHSDSEFLQARESVVRVLNNEVRFRSIKDFNKDLFLRYAPIKLDKIMNNMHNKSEEYRLLTIAKDIIAKEIKEVDYDLLSDILKLLDSYNDEDIEEIGHYLAIKMPLTQQWSS
ncbi:hypothetical protein [Neisseria sp. Ec49-e6-T10]|uniref:hypothetical protein n=1 Tax=Neisseria sp. Ec49-e6-T10 TaxID=3140744 RepID=UPI003EBBA914